MSFVFYGFVFNGPLNVLFFSTYEQYLTPEKLGDLEVAVCGRRFALPAKLRSAVCCVLCDQMVASPGVYVPVFYMVTVRPHTQLWQCLAFVLPS